MSLYPLLVFRAQTVLVDQRHCHLVAQTRVGAACCGCDSLIEHRVGLRLRLRHDLTSVRTSVGD